MKVTECRICRKEPLVPVLDYGHVALADAFLDRVDPAAPEPTYPLSLCVCAACGHLQIDEIVSPELLFRDYIYLTGVSDMVIGHANALCESVLSALAGVHHDPIRVVEAASNDGTVLSVFQKRGCQVLGVDPARNIAKIANERGVPTMAEFFDETSAAAAAARLPEADVFIARNVLAHVADLHGFAVGIGKVLGPRGVGVIEVPHALTMFETLQYDQVFHEHIGYFTLDSLRVLLRMHGLDVFHVEEVAIHGGSLRAYIAKDGAGRAEQPSVARVLAAEAKLGLATPAAWVAFAGRVHEQKAALRAELTALRAAKKRVVAYGASGKGQAMLQFCDIDVSLVEYVVDKSPWKQEKLTPGTHIPVHATERLLADQPDVVLLSAWNFADEIRRQQDEYVKRGGKMLHPLPLPHYLD